MNSDRNKKDELKHKHLINKHLPESFYAGTERAVVVMFYAYSNMSTHKKKREREKKG